MQALSAESISASSNGEVVTVSKQVESVINQNIAKEAFLWGGYYTIGVNYTLFNAIGAGPVDIPIGMQCIGCFQNDPNYGTVASSMVLLTVT